MFVPGDPVEERRRALLAKLSGRGGKGSGGFRVGRPSGAGFGRGMGFGGTGGMGQRAISLPQMLSGYGEEGFQGPPPPGQEQFNMGNDVVNMGGTPNQGGNPAFNPAILHQLLSNYGQPPQPPAGYGNKYF